VSGLFSTNRGVGLFEIVTGSGSAVKNVGVVDADISFEKSSASTSGSSPVGGVVAWVDSGGSVTNCYSTGKVANLFLGTDGISYAGGVAGRVEGGGSVTGCYSSATVTHNGACPVGGVVGHVTGGGDVIGCYFTGTVSYEPATGIKSLTSVAAGGVVGTFSSGVGIESKIINSYSTGTVNSKSFRVGGVVGYFIGTGSMMNCYSTGKISGRSYVGGLVGYLADKRSIVNCYSNGTISGNTNVGGLVGYLSGNGGGVVENSYSAGTVSGDSAVGGVIGNFIGNYSWQRVLANSYSIAAVSGTRGYAGGVVGIIGSGNISINSCVALNPNVTAEVNTVGRIIGGMIGTSSTEALTLSDNIAFSGIKNNQNNTDWPNKGADQFDGADIAKAEIIADGTIGGRFTAESSWTLQNGKLPGLSGNVVDLPEHLK